MSTRDCHVVAGIVRDQHGRVLITQRPDGKHMAGSWEFPGGKLEEGEDCQAALRRELLEELGIVVHKATALLQIPHQYSDRKVLLDFWCVEDFEGQPVGAEGQQLRWVRAESLHEANILAADKPAIDALLAQ